MVIVDSAMLLQATFQGWLPFAWYYGSFTIQDHRYPNFTIAKCTNPT